MGYSFGDFMQDITLPEQIFMGTVSSVAKTAGSTVQSVASSLSLPLMIGGGAILLIMLNKK